MCVISFQRETKAYRGQGCSSGAFNPDFDSSITKKLMLEY
jgi:hypothetical protein